MFIFGGNFYSFWEDYYSVLEKLPEQGIASRWWGGYKLNKMIVSDQNKL